MSKLRLYLFTNSFPFDDQFTEIPFLKEEAKFLNEHFELIIIPYRAEGKRHELLMEIKFDLSLAEVLKQNREKKLFWKLFRFIFQPKFISELLKILMSKPTTTNISRLISEFDYYLATKKWTKNTFKDSNFIKPTIFYTYWTTSLTLGIGKGLKHISNTCLIARAHRGDLYFDKGKFIPYFKEKVKILDKLFLISDDGMNYIQQQLPEYSSKYLCSRLGIERKYNKQIEGDSPEICRIVSCSMANAVKRLDLMFFGLNEFAATHKEKTVEWVHFGGGQFLPAIKDLAQKQKHENLILSFRGLTSNDEVQKYYSANKIDCFINTSASEGLPVSIMEAVSYGIPVAATDVGGVSEIVNNNNGRLMSSTPSFEEISNVLKEICLNREFNAKAAEEAVKTFDIGYSAEKNYKSFIQQILILVKDN